MTALNVGVYNAPHGGAGVRRYSGVVTVGSGVFLALQSCGAAKRPR